MSQRGLAQRAALMPCIADKAGFTRIPFYRPFKKTQSFTFPIEPYCVKLFENRWYVLAYNVRYGDIRLYGLDRMESAEVSDDTFKIHEDFDAEEFFSGSYGIVVGTGEEPERIVLRANKNHKYYLQSLPLHHSQ